MDEDPITKMRTTVTQASGRSITISQSNNTSEIVCEYDKQSGMLIGTSYFTVVTRQNWEIRLAGQE